MVVAALPYLIVALEIIWKSAIEVGWIWLWIERITGLGCSRPGLGGRLHGHQVRPVGGGWTRSE